jgi:hypothetical protein
MEFPNVVNRDGTPYVRIIDVGSPSLNVGLP